MTTLQVLSNSGSTVTIDDAKRQELQMTFRGPLLGPGDAGYDHARVVYNGVFDRRPGLIIRCRSTADVIDAVNLAREHDLLVTVRGGGHSVAGNSICDGGLMIDLAEMNGVHLDRKAGTVRAQGGATWGDLDRETQAFGLAAPGGVVSHTGIAGLTLNGGIGWLRNKYGLSCDNLVSAEVVTAAGELVTASASENPDLFWALRGGGGNFGVVTSFEFRVHPVGPIVAAALPIYALADAPSILRQWRQWVVTTPDEVTAAVVIWSLPDVPELPEPVRGQAVIIPAAVYAGPVEEGERVLQPPRQFGTPLFDMSGALPYRGVQSSFDPFFPNTGQVLSYWKSLYVNELSDDVLNIIVETANGRPSQYSLMNIPYIGGAVRRVRPDETAFPTRDAPFMISLDANWHQPDEAPANIAWARAAWDRLRPHSNGAVYLNFTGQEERDADALVRGTFGQNYDRLVEVKTKYDPTNLFRMNQNIRPAATAAAAATTTEANKAVARRFLEEVFSQGRLDLVDEIVSAEFIGHESGNPQPMRGPAGVRRALEMYRGAFPDLQFTIEEQVAEGDKVVTRWRSQGTHRGEIMGIPPTGKQTGVTGVEIDRIENGRLVESWTSWDTLGLLQQLGVVPSPQQATV